MDCGCESRKEVMFLHGGAGGMDLALFLGIPLGILLYLALRKASK